MKIFITGIAGFIGFHLAQELRAYGYEVLGCDDYNGYYDKSGYLHSINAWKLQNT